MDSKANHGLALLEQLWRMKEMDELTDVVLVTQGVRFPCHRVVLSAFSPYFRVMFTCGMQECSRREVELQETPAESLGLILKFMYSSELVLSNANVQGVSTTAFLLQMEDVFKLCQRHMVDNVDASNCLGLYHYARDLGAEELARQAQRYVCQHFAEVCLNEEVLELNAHQLLALVGSDDLNVAREESVLDLVLRWVSRRREEREQHLPALLQAVRLELVDPAALRQVRRRNALLLRDSECFSTIDIALRVSQLPTSGPRRATLRYGMETTRLLLCLGRCGIDARQGSVSEYSFCYAPTTRQTCFIPSPKYKGGLGCISAGVVTEENEILVAGEANAGRQKIPHVEIHRYNTSSEGSWEKLCSADYRDMYALGSLGGTLYLLGGQMKLNNHYTITNCVERFSMEDGLWSTSAPLPLALACHCAVSLKNRLYVLGGWTPQSDRPDDEPDRLSNRMFQFDPSTNSWTQRRPMKYSKYRCSTVTLNGEIYVMGGIGCEKEDHGQSRYCLDIVEIYNPEADSWREGPPLPSPLLSLRTNGSNAGVVEGKLYVCGAYKGADRHEIITKDILEFDPLKNQWTVLAHHVNMHNSFDVCLVASLNPRDLVAQPSGPNETWCGEKNIQTFSFSA